MYKVIAALALMVALSACYAGFGVGDNAQRPVHVANDAWGSAVAQAGIGSGGR